MAGADGATNGSADVAGPLAGVRIVDVTDERGALCGRILADLGADVLWVDPTGAGPGSTAAFRFRHANKRWSGLDLTTTAGQAGLDELLSVADVVVDNVALTRRPMVGLEPEAVAARHPHLVHVALTDLGLTGPLAGWHLEALPALAASGALHASGFPDLPPCNAPGHLAHDCASVHGALGAVAALLDRRRHGQGQLVEVSAQEAALAGTTPWSIAMQDYTHINPLLPVEGRRNADGAYWVLPARDGWVRAVIGTTRQWDGFVALLGNPDALTGPEWHTPGFRLMNADVVRIVAQECMVDRTRAELFDQALGHGTTIGMLQTVREFVAHPQTRSRGVFLDTGFPGLGGAPFAQLPIRLSATPASVRGPAPAAGDAAAGFEGAARVTVESLAAAGEAPDGLLLAGVRVVEFGVAAVVPELCGVLSELGADVIKIESLAHPDVLRQTGGARLNCGFAFNTECRGRRSVALDLATDEGRALAFELCAGADIVAENHRGGVLERLGLGYDDVRKVNPGVIYAASQGYGRGGPFGEMPAYGPLNSGFSGVHLQWNHPDAPFPCGTSLNHPDHIAGKLLAVAVLAALDHRERSGEGQLLDMAQTEASAYLIGELYLDADDRGEDPPPLGNRSDAAVPHGVYPSDGTDRWVAIAVVDDAAWRRLVEVLGWTHEPALDRLAGRLAARDRIDADLAAWTSALAPDDAAARLQAAGVSAMPVMGPVQHHADPHLAERGFIVQLSHPEAGPERQVGNPTRFSRLRQRTAASAPCLGADTVAVLGELGYDAPTVGDLEARGICR